MMDQKFREKVIAAQVRRGWGNAELARQAGVSYDVVRELHRRPNATTSAENAERLTRALGLNDAPVEVHRDNDLVPIYNVSASAGYGALVSDHEEIVDRLSFPPGYLRKITSSHPKNLAIIGVKGKSMEPTLSDDDIVMVDISKTDLSYDGLFVVRDGGDSLLVKRISRGSRRGTVVLVSDNPQYPNQERAFEEIDVVGKVIWKGVKE